MYDVTHSIEHSKKGKAKYSNEFTMQCYLLFLLLCIEMFRGEEEKGEEPTTLNRGIIKNLCAFERHEDLHACM